MRMRNFAAVMMATAWFAGTTAGAAAQEAEDAFAKLDADRSGTITWDEAHRVRVREFTEMDADGDGVVTREEFAGPARPLAAFDSDGDGELHMSEFIDGHWTMFVRFVEDDSGTLDPAGFEAALCAARGG